MFGGLLGSLWRFSGVLSLRSNFCSTLIGKMLQKTHVKEPPNITLTHITPKRHISAFPGIAGLAIQASESSEKWFDWWAFFKEAKGSSSKHPFSGVNSLASFQGGSLLRQKWYEFHWFNGIVMVHDNDKYIQHAIELTNLYQSLREFKVVQKNTHRCVVFVWFLEAKGIPQFGMLVQCFIFSSTSTTTNLGKWNNISPTWIFLK